MGKVFIVGVSGMGKHAQLMELMKDHEVTIITPEEARRMRGLLEWSEKAVKEIEFQALNHVNYFTPPLTRRERKKKARTKP